MAEEQLPGRHWFCLPPGTMVEEWRVVGCRGHGAYGIVYRAVRVGQKAAGEVALKVAVGPCPRPSAAPPLQPSPSTRPLFRLCVLCVRAALAGERVRLPHELPAAASGGVAGR